MPHMIRRIALPIVFAFAFPNLVMPVQAQLVPGTGQQIIEVFDDFEDPNWNFTPNLPKSSANIDKVERHPSGMSDNGKYLESMYRGTPDFVRRVETPPGGIPGSTGSLAMQTLNSGIPGARSHTFQQDDLIAGMQNKLGYSLPSSWSPSYVCRVYIPPFEKWERRNGSHFGFRADCVTTINTPTMGRFFKNVASMRKQEQYWPGFFIQLNMKNMTGAQEDSAVILIRSDERGHEVPGPKITRPGWWTLGMSFTPDGRVHYYAHEGVANLTAKDHLYSNFPYGYKCEQTTTYFFNIVNQDDGHSWSTRWIVDDPKAYVASGNYRPTVQPQMAQKPAAPVAPAVPANPAATPVQTPATTTAQLPAAAPAQAPAVAPGQMPAAIPAQAPTTVTAKLPAAAPAQSPSVAAQPPAAPVPQVVPARPQAQPTAIPLSPPVAKTTVTPTAPVTAAKPQQPQTVQPRIATSPSATTPSIPIPQLATKPAELPKLAPQTESKPQTEAKPEPKPAEEPKPQAEVKVEPKVDADASAPALLHETEAKPGTDLPLSPPAEQEPATVAPTSAETPAPAVTEAPTTVEVIPQTPPAPAIPQ